MQPYQEAGQEIQNQRTRPFKAAASIASHTMPFLNTYIPLKLAVKGLSRIDPRFGKFMDEAVKLGYGLDQVKDFIKSKVNPEKEGQTINAEATQQPDQEAQTQQPAKSQRNVVEQYDPELHQFIDQQIKSGRSPIEAGALAQNDKKYKAAINKITKDHKAPWSAILQSVYGAGQTARPAAQEAPQMQQEQGAQGGDKWGQITQGLQNLLNS